MNVGKIRKIAAKAPPEVLLEVFCAAYKKVPKDQKDELDTVVLSLLQGADKGSEAGLDQLEADFQQFADDVYDRKYCSYPYLSPAKAAKTRWDARMRSFLQVLDGIPGDAPNYARVGKLYIALYRLMGQAYQEHLFHEGNPYKVLRYSQEDLLRKMVTANLSVDSSPEMLRQLIETICRSDCHWDTYPRALQANLLPLLRSEQRKEDALAQTMQLAEEFRKQQEKDPSPDDSYANHRYAKSLDDLVLQIAYTISPQRMLDCLDFYYAHSKHSESEAYVALRILSDFITAAEEKGEDPGEIRKTWNLVYEDALRRGIQPREELQEQYAALKG